MTSALCVICSYLLGTVNPAFIISKAKGFDIREKGTTNAGATNAMFSLGFYTGVLVMLLDVGKAFLAVTVAGRLSGLVFIPALCGLACVLGHVFPFYMGFHGGKGVACLAGTVLALTPTLVLPLIAFAFIVGVVSNRASLIPPVCAAVYPGLYYLMRRVTSSTMILIALALLIIYTHLDNIKRYKSGKESSFRKVVFGRDLDSCVEREDRNSQEDK